MHINSHSAPKVGVCVWEGGGSTEVPHSLQAYFNYPFPRQLLMWEEKYSATVGGNVFPRG